MSAFCNRIASAPQARMASSAAAKAASSSCSETHHSTSPQRSAVAALIISPVSSSRRVRPQPMSCGSSAASITEGIPTLTSGMPNLAPTPAMRRSQEAAISSPAPSAYPSMRAITGTGKRRRLSQASWRDVMKARALVALRPTIARISAPPMNALSPAPRSTSARRCGSRPSARTWRLNSSIRAGSRMFSFRGLSTLSVAMRPAPPRSSTVTVTAAIAGGSGTLDQFDLVAVGVLDEGNDGRAELNRAGRPSDLDALFAEPLAGRIDIRHADRQMAEAGADAVGLLLIPVVREFDHGVCGFVAIAHKGERIPPSLDIVLADELHAEEARIEVDRFVEIEHAYHRVQHTA